MIESLRFAAVEHAEPRSRLAGTASPRWHWAAGIAGAVLVLGPAFGPGGLLSLDLVLTPRLAFPDAMLGLGHELPRRVPLGAALSWVSNVVGGPVTGKALFALSLTLAFVGAARLAQRSPWPAQVMAGTVYAFGPFTLTRLGAGHWSVVAAIAVLPFALPHLLAPGRAPLRTFLWMTALSVTGVFGGLVGVLIIVVACAFDRGRGLSVLAPLAVMAQLVWLVPGLLIRGGGLALASGQHFTTTPEGPVGVAGGLLAQHGFWRTSSQIGGVASTGLVLVGFGIGVLALLGTRELPRLWRRPLCTLGAIGFLAAAAPAVPLLRTVHAAVIDWTVFTPFRESHRLLALFLLWEAPCAALGLTRIVRDSRFRGNPERAGAFGVALVATAALAAPGMWGLEGRLRPVEFPPAWADVAALIANDPAPVLSLPWHQYLNLEFAEDRRVLNPLPDFLDADVISSHDPELGPAPLQESTDPREAVVREMLPRVTNGDPVSRQLASMGVRWIVLVHEADWTDYRGLGLDPGLTRVVDDPAIELFEVEAPIAPAARSEDGTVWKPIMVLAADVMVVAFVILAALSSGRGTRHIRRTRRAANDSPTSSVPPARTGSAAPE